jgi:hypothetical protein
MVPAGAGLAGGIVLAGAVAGLLHRVLRPAAEISRYADDISAAADGIAERLQAADQLSETRSAAGRLAELLP